MKKMFLSKTAFALMIFMALAAPAVAQMTGHGEHGGKGMDAGEGHGMGGSFGPGWRETLTDEQKLNIDKMHRDLKKEMTVLRATIKLKEAELASLVTADSPDMKAIDKKIGEMADLKKEKMRKRYGHIIEMRKALTPEQRISFDMDVIRRAGDGGKGRKGH